MESSLQCDLSYATFHIGDKAITVDRETRANHIFGDDVDKDSTCFLDTTINAFRAKLVIQEVEKFLAKIKHEVEFCTNSPLLWTMFFDVASSKEGIGQGQFLYLQKRTPSDIYLP